jgi:hypothetical protein
LSVRDRPYSAGYDAASKKAAMSAEACHVKIIAATLLLVAAAGVAAAQVVVPLPRPRPHPEIAEERKGEAPLPPSACRLRLKAEFAVAPSIDPIDGPGECGNKDLVRLEAVILPDAGRIEISPHATLSCETAEAIVHWLRDDLAPLAGKHLAPLRSVQNYASYHCRGRNNIAGAPISEHGRGNALDIRSVRLTDGRVIEPTDPAVSKEFREGWRRSVCARFNTVLGPGSDGYHENHIHVDLMQRRFKGYKMCQWDIRMPEEKPAEVATTVPLPPPRPKIDAAGR